MTRSGRRALITGVAGQDGAFLAALLVEKGYDVLGLLQPNSPPAPDVSPYLEGVRLDEVDLRDRASIARVLESHRPDEVYNLAGISSVAESWRDPVTVTEVNALAVLQFLELLRHQDRPVRFLQASSAEMFGTPRTSPQDETTPLAPRNPYAIAKAFAHHATAMYRTGFGLHASTVILYNHESVLREPAFVTRKISSTVAAIAVGKATELVLGDLDVRRDWGHARDYVQAMWLALQRDVGDDYVVATGVSHSVRDFVATAFRCAGIDEWKTYVRSDAQFVRPSDAAELAGDSTKAHELLGWRPSVDFETLVAEMVDHDRRHLLATG